jgi:hypothetical protein
VGRMFSACRLLGRMLACRGSQGQALMAHDLAKGTTISANYLVRAEFERGSAEIDIKLIKHGAQWQILGFHVKPTYETQRSNQALQPTAGRRYNWFHNMKALPEIFTRALASHG